MNNKQIQRLGKLMNPSGTPAQLAYIQSVMLTEFAGLIKREPERMAIDYGNCLFRYLENLTNES